MVRTSPGRFCASVLLASLFAAAVAQGGTVTIGFDDRPGIAPPFDVNQPVPPQYVVDDEYAGLGVFFSSQGGGILVYQTPLAISPMNAVTGLRTGEILDYTQPISASFFLNGQPAVVDSVSLTKLSWISSVNLVAYDLNGNFIGNTPDFDLGVSTVTFVAAGQIHSVTLFAGGEGSSLSFDDFSFTNLVPEPSALTLLVGAAITLARGRRH